MLVIENHWQNAKILETCWNDVCAAGSKYPCKIVPFNNPDVLGLVMLMRCREYIHGQMTDAELEVYARYLNSMDESHALYEYMHVFSFKYIDPWSVHVDAAYIYCKLRVSGTISQLLQNQEPESLEQCQKIDEFVLTRIHKRYVSRYMRLAANKNTFATITEFCKQAIGPMRDSQEYLCGLIEFIEIIGMTKSTDVEMKSCPVSETAPEQISLSDILYDRYTHPQLVVIARAFKIDDLKTAKTKHAIIQLLINKVGKYLSNPKFINDRISIWRATHRDRSIKRLHSDV